MMKKVAAILSTKLIPFYRVTNIKVHAANVYRGLRGVHRFSLQYLWNIDRLWGNSIVIIGFSPRSVNITGFPHNIHNLSL